MPHIESTFDFRGCVNIIYVNFHKSHLYIVRPLVGVMGQFHDYETATGYRSRSGAQLLLIRIAGVWWTISPMDHFAHERFGRWSPLCENRPYRDGLMEANSPNPPCNLGFIQNDASNRTQRSIPTSLPRDDHANQKFMFQFYEHLITSRMNVIIYKFSK